MRITNKIFLLIIVFIAVLTTNNIFGLNQLKNVGIELDRVVRFEVRLSETATELTRYQLQKAVIFQRIVRVAEELSFGQVPKSRRNYLLAHINFIEENFDQLTVKIESRLNDGARLIQKRRALDLKDTDEDLWETLDYSFAGLDRAHNKYNQHVKDLLRRISGENYAISFEDIKDINREETRLIEQLSQITRKIQGDAQMSLQRARGYESIAQQWLWRNYIVSILIIGVVALLLMRSITAPLKRLEEATKKAGSGNLDIHLDEGKGDEISEVSKAFNEMAHQLKLSKKELEQKNRALKIHLDLTERQKHDLERVNKELDSFVDTVAHDIKAPLMGIMWCGSLLQKKYKDKLDPKGQECIDGVVRGVKRLEETIKDLLSLTHVTRVRNPYEQVDITDLLKTVLERLEFNIKVFNADLIIQEPLPMIMCDRVKLGEVFLNLINNAIKYSSKTGRRPTVDIGYIECTNDHQFIIKDNGIGIDPEHHDKIFDVFHRLDEAKEYEGSGAGLGIVKRIINDHNGKIWVESAPDEGAAFYFTIPKNLTS